MLAVISCLSDLLKFAKRRRIKARPQGVAIAQLCPKKKKITYVGSRSYCPDVHVEFLIPHSCLDNSINYPCHEQKNKSMLAISFEGDYMSGKHLCHQLLSNSAYLPGTFGPLDYEHKLEKAVVGEKRKKKKRVSEKS